MRRLLLAAICLACGLCVNVPLFPALAQPADDEATIVTTEGEYSSYADSNDVYVYTPAVSANVEKPLSGWSFGGSYLADIVSAASVDIISTATPAWQETRHAGTAQASYKPKAVGASVAGAFSREPDYLSLSAGGNLSIDLRQKTVTPLIGYTYTHDTSGRRHTPFSVYALELDRHTINGALNIIANPETLLTFTGDVILERGRQEKPYRYVPLFAPGVASQVPIGASADIVNQLRLPGKVAESLPHERNRYAVSMRVAQRLESSTFTIWQRGYVDDWGILASTTDIRMLFDISKRFYIWPHLRAHLQTGATFWTRAYTATFDDSGLATVPALRSGDRELGPLQGVTAGAGVRWNAGPDAQPSRFSVVFLGDGNLVHYSDAVYITSRTSILGVVQLQAELK